MQNCPYQFFFHQLNVTDDQVAAFVEELAAYLEGHLALLDAVSWSHIHKQSLEGKLYKLRKY